MMRTLTLLCLTASFVAAQLAGEVPTVNGVIGGPLVEQEGRSKKIGKIVSEVGKPGKLRVKENHGICETTSDVYQASGYGDIALNQSVFFWHFAARHDPDNAPLSLWFNGGPGSSSLLGLFQSHGPCKITNDSSSVVYNPFSWTNNSNFLFIDQPIGAGFSNGQTLVTTSQQAAVDVWKFLQVFFADKRYRKLASRPLGIWTQSYGGHYGPVFAKHFLDQNARIAAGDLKAIPLNLKTLGIGDGLVDPLTQYAGYLTYAKSNPYHQLVSDNVIARANSNWSTPVTGCKDLISTCYETGTNASCSSAQSYCNANILTPLSGEWSTDYVLHKKPDTYPPSITSYLASIATTIGAEKTWTSPNLTVYMNMFSTGDWMRNSRHELEYVIDAGVRTVIWVGDADYVMNMHGVEAMVNALETKYSAAYLAKPYSNWTIDGKPAGRFKTAGRFSFVTVYGAGHSVGSYKYGDLDYGEAAYSLFNQINSGRAIFST